MIIALDFDGTLVKHRYPEVGEDIGAVPFLHRIKERWPEVRYMLWTVRSADVLWPALLWCKEQGIDLWSVNINPGQHKWSGSNKAHAHVYVDDAALGTPLVFPVGERPYVDWSVMGGMLEARVHSYFINSRNERHSKSEPPA